MDCWELERGAKVLETGGVRFSVWAPFAKRCAVVFPDKGDHAEISMSSLVDGTFVSEVKDAAVNDAYFYRLNGELLLPDPVSRFQPDGVHGPSRVVDPDHFPWHDSDWSGIEPADLVLYEIHVGTFSPAGTFLGVKEKLSHLRELGVTAIELMPLAQFPGKRNWGYDGVFPYAVHQSYGGPEGLRELVDAAHSQGLAVLLDLVNNHLGPEGNYLYRFGAYFTERHHTPWGPGINFDSPESKEVRRYFIDNALYWITEYHIDGLRLDAIQAIADDSSRHFIEELADSVYEQAARLNRRVLVFAEDALHQVRTVLPREQKGFALDAQWNDHFHYALHAALTGDRKGFCRKLGSVRDLERVLSCNLIAKEPFINKGDPTNINEAAEIPASRFLVFSQNHDQVGNHTSGQRIASLVSFEEQKLAASFLFFSPFIPLIFMGEEWGETNPFYYFIDHGNEWLNEEVRKGREKEQRRWRSGPPGPDPSQESTFDASVLNWSRRNAEEHRKLFSLYQDLISLRKSEPVLRPGEARHEVKSSPRGKWLRLLYKHPAGNSLLVAFNFGSAPATVKFEGLEQETYTLRFSTMDAKYCLTGQHAQPVPKELKTSPKGKCTIPLPPHGAALYGSSDTAV